MKERKPSQALPKGGMLNCLKKVVQVIRHPLLWRGLGRLSVFLLIACRDDVMVVPMENIDTGGKAVRSEIVGMYLLNEGNMGSNKSTLDYLDLSASDSTVHYLRNIYSERNPSTVMSLGDVGNDCQVYGSRLWLVINCSNKVEVARASDAVRIGQVNIPNCRYVTFAGRYAYV